MGIRVGIDLGTTFSAVAVMDEKKEQPVIIPNTLGEKTTPSVIQFTEDGEIVVGAEAKEAFEAGESGCASTFKRSMGRQEPYCSFYGKQYTAEELSAILLRYLKEEAESVTGQTIDEAVVTVPAYFYHRERQATMNAARKAGLKIRQIINEPTAAAMNYGVNHWRENARVLVYDLGGGTFDVTLVQMKKGNQMESLQTTGDHLLGGRDWDNRIAGILEGRIEEETGLQASAEPEIRMAVQRCAESVKKQLTSRNTANVRLKLPGQGWFTTTLTLEEFEQSTKDLIERTGTLCESLLQGLGITWRDVTDILLVGGSTRMRQVSGFLKKISGHEPLSQVNPDEAMALGAAIQVQLPLPAYTVITMAPREQRAASGKAGEYKFKRSGAQQAKSPVYTLPGTVGKETALNNALSMSHTDVVAHAMGVIAVNAEGTRYINKTIVPANQKIPVKCAEAFHFYTSGREENEVEIYVLQGTRAPLECEIIGKYVVSGIVHDREKNPTVIRIQYSYDVNGMVHVQARQGDAQTDLPIREEPVPEDMSWAGLPIDPESTKPMDAEPLSVLMAIDVSGSMEGKPLQEAKNAMCHFVESFENYPGDVQIGVIAVSDRTKVVQRPTGDLRQCRKSIDGIQAGMTGWCNEAHPFTDIRDLFEKETGRRFAIVLADGVWENQSIAVKEAKKCHRLGIEITGIGFGCANRKFLQDISSGDIESMLVQQSELTQSFGRIAQEIGATGGGRKGRSGQEASTATWLAIGEG